VKTLIEMAHEVYGEGRFWTEDELLKLKRLVDLARADEREACAKVIESHGPFLTNGAMLAEAIRARGQA